MISKKRATICLSAIVIANLLFPSTLFIAKGNPVQAAPKSSNYIFPKISGDSIKVEAYEEAPLIDQLGYEVLNIDPVKTETFDKPKYAFSLNTKTLEDLHKIKFVVTKGNDEQTKQLLVEPGDNDAISLTEKDYKYISGLFTFEDGIKKIDFYGFSDFKLNTIDFPDVSQSIKALSDTKPQAAESANEFYASQSAEKEFRKKTYQQMGLTLITRDEWGVPYEVDWDPDPGAFYAPEIYNVNRIIVHHTASGGGSNPKAEIKAIHDYHAYTNGWIDIGYNYIIDKYGNIYEGRSGGNGVKGAHAGAATNKGSIGIAMLGTYSSQLPTQAALTSLAKLMAAVSAVNDFSLDWHANKSSFSTASDYGVYGHRDAVATACPGTSLYNYLPQITTIAKNYKTSTSLITLQNEISDLVENHEYIKTAPDSSTVLSEVLVDKSQVPVSLLEKFYTKSRGVEEYYDLDNNITVFKVHDKLAKAFIGETNLIDTDIKAQPNFLYRKTDWDNTSPTRSIPSDYNTTNHWNLEKINAPEAWKELGGCTSNDTCGGSTAVTVAVLDTGAAYEDRSFDAGTDTTYTREKIGGLYIEYTTNTALDGVYANSTNYEGYERDYDAAPELNGITFVNPKDVAWEYLCDLRATTGLPAKYCNASETAQIDHANDDDGHGSSVTSVIAANTGNLAAPTTNRVVGLAHNVQIMPIKIFLPNDTSMCQTSGGAWDPNCTNPSYDYRTVSNSYLIIQGLQHAIDNGAEVINMSIGGGAYDAQLEAKINEAFNAGITLVAASGNSAGAVEYPGAYTNVIAVGASSTTDTRANYSSYGSALELVAPVGSSSPAETGVAVQTYSCFSSSTCSVETNQNLFKTMSSTTSPTTVRGTSFASPQVAAAVALAKSLKSTLTPRQMRNLLLINTQKLGAGYSTELGYGLLDVDAMLKYINDVVNATSNPSTNPSPDGNVRTDIIAWSSSNGQIDVTPSTGLNFGGGYRGYQIWNSDTDIQGSSWNMLSPADVNGDGREDIVAIHRSTSEVRVALSDGSQFGKGYKNDIVWNTQTGYGNGWTVLAPGDVNGDGKADLIAFHSATRKIDVNLSDGMTFGGGYGGSGTWNTDSGYALSSWTFLNPADVNADGMVDIIAFNPSTTQVDVTPSTGTNFGGGWRGYQIWNSQTAYGTSAWTMLQPADVNGDNRADLIAYHRTTTQIDVTPSTGTNFGGGYRGYQIWNSQSAYGNADWSLLTPADVTGDGLADIIAFHRATTKIDVTPSTGSNFGGGYRGYQIWNSQSAYGTSAWTLLH